MTDAAVGVRIEAWKRSLLDASARSGPPAVGEVVLAAHGAAGLAELASLLVPGRVLTPEPAAETTRVSLLASAEPEVATGVELARVATLAAEPELTRTIAALHRVAMVERRDRGEHLVWVLLGALQWTPISTAAQDARRDPVWLVPVALARVEGGGWTVQAVRGLVPVVNPVLAAALQADDGLALVLDDATPTLATVLESARRIAAGHEGWSVDECATLGLYSVESALLARSIERVETALAEGEAEAGGGPTIAPVVAQLVAGGTSPFAQSSAVAAAAVTSRASALASDLLAPLDADASQLQVIAAAAAGASFVVSAPPGTGASQTIANLVVHAATQGQSVLVASDRLAALATVRERLASIGLGDLALDLATDDAEAAPILAQVARVTERSFRPGSSPTGTDTRLGALREELDDHAAALHRVGLFGRSVHAVLGRLVELRAAPAADLADRDSLVLDATTYERRTAAIAALATTALPVEPVSTHAWRAATLTSWPAAADATARDALAETAAAGDELAGAYRELLALVPGLSGHSREQLIALGALATVASRSPRPGAELLTQLRAVRDGDLDEQIALVRARGAGELEVPRDPLAYMQLATRHATLAAEVDSLFAARDPGVGPVGDGDTGGAETDRAETGAAETRGRAASLDAGLDAGELWGQLKKWMSSVGPVRYVALRGARAAIRAHARSGALETDEAMVVALEAVIAERATRAALVAASEPAKRWFGSLWGDPLAAATFDHPAVEAAIQWTAELRTAFDAVHVAFGDPGRAAAWRALVAQVAAGPAGTEGVSEPAASSAVFARLAQAVGRWQPALAALARATGIAEAELGAGPDHLVALRDQIDALRVALPSLGDWVAYFVARQAARVAGVELAVTALERGDLGADELVLAWERATLLAWFEAELDRIPALASFHGSHHHAQVAAFADLDRAALAFVRSRTLARIGELMPRRAPPSIAPVELGTLTPLEMELALVGRYAARMTRESRAHRVPTPVTPIGPIGPGGPGAPTRRAGRTTLSPSRAGDGSSDLRAASDGHELVTVDAVLAALPTVLAAATPCWLVTPRSAARLFATTAPRFDIVVIDGAQRMTVAETLGLLALGRSAVIIGDVQQPTTSRGASLLDAALGARLPELPLAVHYRSRHEDLFAVANARWYGDRVQVLPAAHPAMDLGIQWRRVERGDHAAASQPPGVSPDPGAGHAEAEAVSLAVVAEVLARLRDPGQRTRSLAVLTFSDAQQRRVSELLDAARAADPQLAGQGEGVATATEPLLVEPVDRAHGLERDVVVLALGEPGQLDEARLALATTRAREQLVIVSSFAPDDLATDAPAALHTVAALAAYARGTASAARPAEPTSPASPIIAAIAQALGERGWQVRHRVGSGAYQIDLAVADPSDPERYVLAIEHDGAAYASAPAARDRDRLRGQLLAALGWRVHRIWSLDWWLDPEREIQRAHGAIVTAIAASRQRRAPTAATPRAPVSRGSTPVVRIPPKQPAAIDGPALSGPAREPAPTDLRAAGSGATAMPGRPGPLATGTTGRIVAPDLAAALDSGAAAVARSAVHDSGPTLAAGSAPIRISRGAIAIGPYLVAAIPAGRRAPDDMFAPRHLAELGKVVEQVLAAEAPMHVDLLARRVGAYFGIGRVTQRVSDQVKVALAGRGRWGDEAEIVWRMDQDPAGVPSVRVAGQGPASTRGIDEVPLAELAAAARLVVERAPGIGTKDLVRDAARLLGIARLTEQVTSRIARGIRLAEARTLIEIDAAGKARMPS